MKSATASSVFFALLLLVLAVHFSPRAEASSEKKKQLQIGVKKRVENCEQRSRRGDLLSMHYTVS